MELVTNKVNENLIHLINNAYSIIKDEFNVSNKRIHHMNFYHKDWSQNDFKFVIDYSSILNILKN